MAAGAFVPARNYGSDSSFKADWLNLSAYFVGLPEEAELCFRTELFKV